MRQSKHTEEHVNSERWLLSYADFITLLFALFVVLFASTYRDNQAIRKLSRAIHNGFQTLGAFSTDESGNGGPYSSLAADQDTNTSRVPNESGQPQSGFGWFRDGHAQAQATARGCDGQGTGKS